MERGSPAGEGRSLIFSLLLWLLPLLLIGAVLGMWRSAVSMKQQTEAAFDRSLGAAVRAIDLNVSTASGGLALALPYGLMDFFRMTASGRVYYRVSTEDGLADIGHGGLPLPAQLPPSGQIVFYDALYFEDEAIRVGLLVREPEPPLPHRQGAGGRVIVQVAESLTDRERVAGGLLRDMIGRDVVLLALVIGVLWVGVLMTLRPLTRLRDEMALRADDDLRPIGLHGLPTEVVPLVQGINGHMARFLRYAQHQRQFLDDASHQLRTPLALLRTKVDYALREEDPAEMREAIAAMRRGLERAERVTNQLLALAKAHDAGLGADQAGWERFDLGEMVDETVRLMWPSARQKRLDYGLEPAEGAVPMRGMRPLLQEALLNLLDNAIKYTPEGGTVSTGLIRRPGLVGVFVQDSGPGMSEEDIAQAGLRFRRGAAGKGRTGAGLGLAIVQAIVGAHQGQMRLCRPEAEGGGADAGGRAGSEGRCAGVNDTGRSGGHGSDAEGREGTGGGIGMDDTARGAAMPAAAPAAGLRVELLFPCAGGEADRVRPGAGKPGRSGGGN